jgi:tetratricopeptide (TPR) repeat protein
MGHYRVAIGYDDAAEQIIAQDSYYGARRVYSYAEFEAMSRPFVGAYVAVYPPGAEAAVQAALGADRDASALYRRLAASYAAAVAADPSDRWGWFGLGEALARAGDHAAAVDAFQNADALGLPFRTYWYQFGHYEALIATGRYAEALALADRTLESMQNENLEESHYWRGVALRELGRVDEARASFERASTWNPLYDAPRAALAALRP